MNLRRPSAKLGFRLAAAVVAAGAALAGSALLAPPAEPDTARPAAPAALPGVPLTPLTAGTAGGASTAGREALAATVERHQERLRAVPGDHQAWAGLGVAYVEQARVTADPSWYPKAEQALRRSLELRGDGNHLALTGLAALAAGRHDFDEAARLAGEAIAVNDYHPPAYGGLADARTQLGEYDAATAAIDRMLELEPGVASFARASYDRQLRGDPDGARKLLGYALDAAFTPADTAFCHFHLGELALHAGDTATATRQYELALAAEPDHVPALAGQARSVALSGRLDRAAELYQTVVERLPLPQYVIEYGEVLTAAGRPDQARQQWALLDAQRRLMADAGVRDDLTWAEFEADHGDPAAAVRHARAEWDRNPNVVAADALAWALHRAGEDEEALRHATEATRLGWRNALFHHHRSEIARSLGMTAEAARDEGLVGTFNPRFDPRLPSLARPA